MDQRHFDFIDGESTSHHVKLDKKQRQLLLELMGSLVFHVFESQEKNTDEKSRENRQD